MNNVQKKVFLETRLRNLERIYVAGDEVLLKEILCVREELEKL